MLLPYWQKSHPKHRQVPSSSSQNPASPRFSWTQWKTPSPQANLQWHLAVSQVFPPVSAHPKHEPQTRHAPTSEVLGHQCRSKNSIRLPPDLQTAGWCGHHSSANRASTTSNTTAESSRHRKGLPPHGRALSNWAKNQSLSALPDFLMAQIWWKLAETKDRRPESAFDHCKALPPPGHSASNWNEISAIHLHWWRRPGEMWDPPPTPAQPSRAPLPPGRSLSNSTWICQAALHRCLVAAQWWKLHEMQDLPQESLQHHWGQPQLVHSPQHWFEILLCPLRRLLVVRLWQRLDEIGDQPPKFSQHQKALLPPGHSPRNCMQTCHGHVCLLWCLMAGRWWRPHETEDQPPKFS